MATATAIVANDNKGNDDEDDGEDDDNNDVDGIKAHFSPIELSFDGRASITGQ